MYGTIASNITMTPSTGTISAKAIERDGLELTRAFGSLLPYGVAIAPTKAAPTVLNKIDYLKIGNYYCSSNASAKYVTDLPLADTAFMMQVLSPLSTEYDNESTSTWVYRLRVLRYYTGQEFTQYCYSNGTAGNWTYGPWLKTVVEDVSTGTVTATKFSGSGASLTSLNANNISSGKLGLAYGGTGATTAANARTNLGVPPTSHASTGTSYGVSTAANYGHAMASSTTPKANGTAAVGSETAKFARGDHVHPLQTTVSGNAGTATKLATARTISLGDQLQGSASFNGSANITINAQLKNVSVGGANTNTYLYRRFASGAPGTGQYADHFGIFLIASNCFDGPWGIIKVAHRVNNTGASCGMTARWLVRDGFAEDSVSVASYGVSGDDVYFDVFFKCHATWPRVTITSLGPTNLSLYSSSEGIDSSSPSEAYTTIANAGTSLHGKAYTNIVASVQAGIYGAVWN